MKPAQPARDRPQDQPAYRAAEAARILALPSATVRAWCFGQSDRFRAVIAPAAPAERLLSFTNLCELHVLAAMRRRHRVTLPVVRRALDYVSQHLRAERPLVAREFRTNGVALFVKEAGQLLNVSDGGQQALQADFEAALARIDYGKGGLPVALFPYTRLGDSRETQPRTVVVDPTRAFGRPVISGALVRTEVVEDRFRAGDTIEQMATDYAVPASVIEEALRFERLRAADTGRIVVQA
jgi:uncharacterized protein (DUF433 family)